jgi:hypothetical protein
MPCATTGNNNTEDGCITEWPCCLFTPPLVQCRGASLTSRGNAPYKCCVPGEPRSSLAAGPSQHPLHDHQGQFSAPFLCTKTSALCGAGVSTNVISSVGCRNLQSKAKSIRKAVCLADLLRPGGGGIQPCMSLLSETANQPMFMFRWFIATGVVYSC